MAYRWTKMEFTSSQREMSLADPGASWIYHLMDLAIKEKDQSGYSPFNNVEFLRMDFPWVQIVALQDLLSQLPMLKHLDASGVVPDPFRALFTHGALEVFKTGDMRRLPTLETLVLQVPFNNEWAAMKGTVFRSLREHSSDSLEMPLPRLREIMMHMYGKKGRICGICALRDAFIDFVEDPRRGLTDNETDDISEADNLSASIEEGGESSSLTPEVARAARLEIARFDYEDEDRGRSGVIYHAGKDYAQGLFLGDEHFIWG
ncbi:hypothetical protein BKA70DRAFT_1231671 [Coprinopsis sp. MPI-PUGE-AT-0042]|nr:hypothetical protein BKA70DRAFT_1231671 [Coprinopsis sp. MPI-PUGE-AT-0042]